MFNSRRHRSRRRRRLLAACAGVAQSQWTLSNGNYYYYYHYIKCHRAVAARMRQPGSKQQIPFLRKKEKYICDIE